MTIKNYPRTNGFSLIELVIVLVIMSFVFAVVGPGIMRGLSGVTLKTAVKKVASALRYAHSQAVNRAQPYSVIFDQNQNRIVIRSIPTLSSYLSAEDRAQASAADGGEEAADKKELPKEELKVFSLPEGVSFKEIAIGGKELNSSTEEIAQLFFFPDGTSQGGELSLIDTKDRIFTIAVDFLTGVVTVEQQET